MNFLYANNAASVITAAITPNDTTITVTPGTGDLFPVIVPGYIFAVTLSDTRGLLNEIVHVTAVVGDTFTVVRAQEGTTALAWPNGSKCQNLLTEEQTLNLVQYGLLNPTLNKTPAVPNFSAVGFGAIATATPVTTTDYTTQLQAAIDMAVSTGSSIYFPPGYIYCASSLNNFHNVKKWGPGAVYSGPSSIGTGVFWIDPTATTNNLFCSLNGVDTNDGLSASRPTLTVQQPLTIAGKYTGNRSWTFNFTPEEFTLPASMSYNSITFQTSTVRFVGVAATTGGQPNTIFKGLDTDFRVVRFLSSSGNTNFIIQNVYFKNLGSVNAASQGGRITLTNCWSTNINQMVSLGNMGFATATMGVWDFRDTNGIIIPNSVGAGAVIGSFYNYDQGTLGNIGLIIQFADRGIITNECCSGHEDAVRVFDCNVGQEFTRTFGAANLSGTIFNRCAIGILVRGPGMLLVNNTQNFGTGPDACTIDIVYTNAPTWLMTEELNYDPRSSWQNRSYSIATTITPDGTAKNFFGTAGSIVARRPRIGDTLIFTMSGRFIGALAVAAAINFNLGGTPVLAQNLAFPSGTVEWVITANFMVVSNYDRNNPTTAQQIRGIIEIRAYDANGVALPGAGKRMTTANLLSVVSNTPMNWTITETTGGSNFQFNECTINSTIGGFTYP